MDQAFKDKLLKLLDEFIQICESNNLWWCLDRSSLVGAVKDNKMLPWKERIEVMMDIDSFERLERMMSIRIVDNFKCNWYKSYSPAFVSEKENYRYWSFISIRIVVPTKRWKIIKHRSFKRNMKFWWKKDNYKKVIEELIDNMPTSFYLISKNRKTKLSKCYIQNFTFKTEIHQFENRCVKIPMEHKNLLSRWYGTKYKTLGQPKKLYFYPFPGRKISIKFINNLKEKYND